MLKIAGLLARGPHLHDMQVIFIRKLPVSMQARHVLLMRNSRCEDSRLP
jgi:hypothetical protein